MTEALDAVVLLAGRVGSNALAAGIGRPILDLPLGGGRTLLHAWRDQLERFARESDRTEVLVRVAVDSDTRAPRLPEGCSAVRFEVVGDAAEYRGTAGVVKDVTRDLAEGTRLIVAGANQVQVEPLSSLLEALEPEREGVSVVPSGSGDIAGVFVLRRERLRDVADVGFVDLKEQAVPSMGSNALRVTRRAPGTSLPVRTLGEYVAALRSLHGAAEPGVCSQGPFAEGWQPRFALVESGAAVADDAVLQDAVVLAGATVERGAVVARSVVCPGGVVRKGSYAVDAVVTS